MKQSLSFVYIAIFSIFIGSQLTEAFLLVPYWQSLTAEEFYSYYNQFGPSIGLFYTVLTIIAALIPISLSVYCKYIDSSALMNASISTFFAILFVAAFYVYFKGANDLFYQASLSSAELKRELAVWSYWHWGRIIIEFLSLFFLMLAFDKAEKT